MGNALMRQASPAENLPPGAQDAALSAALEEARQLAVQARLLALNTAFESAGAGPGGEMDVLGGEAGHAVAATEKVAAAVELLLQQIQLASLLSGHCETSVSVLK